MFETAGPLAIVQPVLTLVGLIGLPLLWTLVAMLSRQGVLEAAPVTKGRLAVESSLIPVIVSITCAVGTLALSLVFATHLALLPANHLLVQHVAQLGRLGQLDLAFDLSLDPRSATFAVVIALVACASTLHTAWSNESTVRPTLAWTGLITVGSLLVTVGDGFAPVLVGLGLVSLSAWGLSRGGDPTPNAASLAGNVSIFLGLVFLFWSLGGVFGPEGYDADGAPRFVLVAARKSTAAGPKSVLTMTSHAGALVSSDDADLPGEPVAAPFSIVVDPGVYTLRVAGGVASGDVVVPRVALLAGREHVLTPYGPTASLRVLDDQVAVPRLASTGAFASVRAALSGRTIGGLRASAIVLLLALGGVLGHVHALASRRGRSPIALILEAVAAPYLALRLVPLIDPSAADGALVVILGCGSALALAARAAAVDDEYQGLRGVLAAALATAVGAAGIGESAAALVVATSALLATSAAIAAIDARRDVRWLGVACAAAVGLLPGAGASSGFILTITTALASSATGSVGWAVFAAGTACAMVLTMGLSALAAFRVYDAVIHASVREPGRSRGQGIVVISLAMIALVGGTALGVGTSPFGGTVVPLSHRLAPVAAASVAPKSMAAAALLLSLVASVSGVLLARRVSAAPAVPPWITSLGRPYAVFGFVAGVIAWFGEFLHRSVRAMDRDVIDDVPAAAEEIVARLTRLIARRRPTPAATTGDVLGTPGVEPGGGGIFRTSVLLLMLAILALVVLSSFFLR